MSLPPRRFYPVSELADAWSTNPGVLIELAVDQQIEICARLFGTRAERREGEFPGNASSLVMDTDVLTGVFPLLPADLWRIRCHNIARVRCFYPSDTRTAWWQIVDDQPDVEITPAALLVSADERARFERDHNLAVPEEAELFSYSEGYRTIWLRGRPIKLSATRAKILKVLHEAWLAGSIWVEKAVLLETAGSESSRVADVFTDVEERNLLLVSDHKGYWRINLPIPTNRTVAAFRRAFRKPFLVLVK